MMNCLSYISSAAIFSRNSHVTMRSSFCGFSSIVQRRGIGHGGFKAIKLDSILTGLRAQCFSTLRVRASRVPKVKLQPTMEEDADAFYVVRKGDVVGVYKSLHDCQIQVSSSVCDPAVSVYKGCSLHKETERYLASRGLKDALFSMHAADLKEDLFGTLVPCPFQQPSVDKIGKKATAQKRSNEMDAVGSSSMSAEQSKHPRFHDPIVAQPISSKHDAVGSSSMSAEQSKHPRFQDPIVAQPISSKHMTCILEFDGASKGNPGQAGAGAILRTADGSVVARVRESLGIATNNVAEYRALILGMKLALKKGFKQIQVQGDSKLVCMQVQDLWQTKNQNMTDLCKEVKRLKQMFVSFKISHVLREFNSHADAEANLALNLGDGEVYEECAEFL